MTNNNTTILTYNFGSYDKIYEPKFLDYFKWVLVSDRNEELKGYTLFELNSKNNWESVLYARYHPFKFTDTDIVIVIDGSLSATDGVIELHKKFVESNSDICVLLSHQPSLYERVLNWLSQGRIDKIEQSVLTNYIKENVSLSYKGTVAGAVKILRKSDKVLQYLNKCYETIMTLNKEKPIRLDEVVSTIELNKFDLKIMTISTEVINGSAFIYHHHSSDKPRKLLLREKNFYFKNEIVKPTMIGKEYNREYKYKSEALCLTRWSNEHWLKEWIEHHLEIGFDHIHIMDNMSDYPCKEICNTYGNKVSYEYIDGNARHYKLFDDYINSERCKSEWIMPIDDDEYLIPNKDICNTVHELIGWFLNKYPDDQMFAIRWKHMFPIKFHSDSPNSIFNYCVKEDSKLASLFQPMGDRGIKTLVHRYGHIHYEETEENPSGGHVPKHDMTKGARLFNGELIKKCSCRSFTSTADEPARLMHCRYKGYTWYKNKMNDIHANQLCLDNTSGLIYTRNYKFDEILETLD